MSVKDFRLINELRNLVYKYRILPFSCLCTTRESCEYCNKPPADIFKGDNFNTELRNKINQIIELACEKQNLKWHDRNQSFVNYPFHFKPNGIQYSLEEEEEFKITG